MTSSAAAGERFLLLEQERARARRAALPRLAAGLAVAVVVLAGAMYGGEVRLATLARGIPDFLGYLRDTIPAIRLGSIVEDLKSWQWGARAWLALLAKTAMMAIVSTSLGFAMALLLCFPAARNLAPARWACVLCRRLLEVARTIPELVYAMIFVFAFGIGPFAGVLAITIHTVGALGKLFSEVNENLDARHLEGITATGGGCLHVMRHGVAPMVLPNFASYGLLRLEINIRSATVMGFVGAGGIGQELMLAIRQFQYADISAIVVWILLMVAALDAGSSVVRRRLLRGTGSAAEVAA